MCRNPLSASLWVWCKWASGALIIINDNKRNDGWRCYCASRHSRKVLCFLFLSVTYSPPLSIQTIRPQFYLSGLSCANRLLSTPAALDGHRQSSCQPHSLAFVSLHFLSCPCHFLSVHITLSLSLFRSKYTVLLVDILMKNMTGTGFNIGSLEKRAYIFAKLQKRTYA